MNAAEFRLEMEHARLSGTLEGIKDAATVFAALAVGSIFGSLFAIAFARLAG
jgi:hypothetical protein